ncbi:methionine synthase [Scytonema sp. UIC 10036]|uniref:Npun_R2821/Npun_R2822 family protein n=1 Tax=Scytonema sp. UIC 10036 TaxID=2304196 RepID=UPI0012DABAC5|nr:Npun_R2821/Npun_R2822 family protein [Scytonema sp. UIC 10036]MUG91292.1 methionine synthase [Scytonema sp. UIC 10036]
MTSIGIYTLANDKVYDQLVALLNSIEVNVSPDIPICVIPYDDKLDLVKQEIQSRKNVTIFDNYEALQRWDDFVNQVWDAHPRARESKLQRPGWYKGFVHRKMAAFDGEFEKFVFYDADSLAMKNLNDVFAKLNSYELVFDDWEHVKPQRITDLNLEHIASVKKCTEDKLRSRIHCNSFVGSHQYLFGISELNDFKKRLFEQQEIEWIKSKFWWASSALFNYMTLDDKYSMFNYTQSANSQDRTGNCANADKFVNINNVLYNQDGLKPIYRLHYMSYSSVDFARLCQGEDVNICYKNEFLHYRFLKQPELKPLELKPPGVWSKTQRFFKKAVNKTKRTIT